MPRTRRNKWHIGNGLDAFRGFLQCGPHRQDHLTHSRRCRGVTPRRRRGSSAASGTPAGNIYLSIRYLPRYLGSFYSCSWGAFHVPLSELTHLITFPINLSSGPSSSMTSSVTPLTSSKHPSRTSSPGSPPPPPPSRRPSASALAHSHADTAPRSAQWPAYRTLAGPPAFLASLGLVTLSSPSPSASPSSYTPLTHSSYPGVELAAGPLEAVGAYRNLLDFLQRASMCSTQLYNYGQLLLFCVCCIARGNGLTVEEVDGIVNKQLPKREASLKYMSRLRRAAQWTAQLIDELEDTLGHLASSLFLLCKFVGPTTPTYS